MKVRSGGVHRFRSKIENNIGKLFVEFLEMDADGGLMEKREVEARRRRRGWFY